MPFFTSLADIEHYLHKQDAKRGTGCYTLERVQQAVVRLDNPQLKYKVIHVGGTSGKGSTCQMIYSILRSAGYKTGIYTSPHLTGPLERLVINGRSIGETAFVKLLNSVWEKIKDLQLTYFELFTVLALYYFAQSQVDYAVIEVGVGGRLDATNVVTPKVAVVTDVGLDHTDLLGKTKRAIAKEKEVIIKPGCIGLTGSTYVKCGRQLNLNEADILKQNLTGTVFNYKTFKNVQLNLVGKYQVRNAILAITVAKALHVNKTAIYQGLKQVKSKARFQVVSKQPLIIIDGAHNPQKMRAFTDSLRQVVKVKDYNQVIVLLALKYSKDATATLRSLLKFTDVLILTSFDQGMSLLTLRQVARQLNPRLKIILQKDPILAYQKLQTMLQPKDLGLVTGSLYMIGKLMKKKLV
ncbi:MAG: folylpolyglutamate synthase/dihydrofolate synthase family protein [Patescibacteria group bacterium]|jgi:dihydrofolate synthase/folylpolyglutamate synthase